MTGTTIAQAIPLASTFILTRLYSPEDFGLFALFLSITAVTGAIANGQYEQAVVLPKKDEDALNIVGLSFFISIVISLLFLGLVFFFKNEFANFLGNNNIANWLYWIPLSVFLVGTYNSLNFFNIRRKEFKRVSTSLISKSSSSSLIQIILGYLSFGTIGLILGQVSSFLFGNTVLYKTVKESKHGSFEISFHKMKELAIKYKKFPIFSLPSIFVNSVNLNIITFLIASIFSTSLLGLYSLTQRVIGIPSRVIGNSMGQVYFQRASEIYKEKGNTIEIFNKTLKKLILFSCMIFSVIYLSSEWVFKVVFGKEWAIAGEYAKTLAPLAAVRFISSTLSSTIVIHEKQQYGLIMNLILLFSTLLLFFIGDLLKLEFKELLQIYVIVFIFEYLLFLYMYSSISRSYEESH